MCLISVVLWELWKGLPHHSDRLANRKAGDRRRLWGRSPRGDRCDQSSPKYFSKLKRCLYFGVILVRPQTWGLKLSAPNSPTLHTAREQAHGKQIPITLRQGQQKTLQMIKCHVWNTKLWHWSNSLTLNCLSFLIILSMAPRRSDRLCFKETLGLTRIKAQTSPQQLTQTCFSLPVLE